MADVLEADEITAVHFNADPIDEELIYNRTVRDPESIQEFADFLSQYNVREAGVRNFTPMYPEEQFSFQLDYEDGSATIPALIERNTVLDGDDQFEVINGPVDYSWIEEFKENAE